MLRRRILAAISAVPLAAALLCLTADSATAAGAWGDVQCGQEGTPGCTAIAGSDGTASVPRSGGQPQEVSQEQHGGSGGTRQCHDWSGQIAPCTDPDYGAMGADGCYYTPADMAVAPDGAGPGRWYWQTCVGDPGVVAMQWLADAEAPTGGGPAAPPPPEVVAQQAVSRLRLSPPRIQASPGPGALQLVRLPTWLWLAPGSWQPQQATASVPGVSVTATATPTKVVWSMGDGSTVTCQGPGTVYSGEGNPAAASPDCGHTYTRSSTGLPGEAFPVAATVSWSISWAGAGQAGQLPDLETTATAAFRVAESQAVIAASSP